MAMVSLDIAATYLLSHNQHIPLLRTAVGAPCPVWRRRFSKKLFVSPISHTTICCASNPSLEPSVARREEIKRTLKESFEGLNRGIFGVTATQKAEIEQLICSLENQNPTSKPTQHLEKVNGEWRLLYSTISILGTRRTKLGLRDFITLSDFLQTIDVAKGKAANIINFTVAGLGMLRGTLTVKTSYVVSSASRVDIQYEKSSIVPEKLFKLFQQNYDLLLSVFNPEGWLEISYVDDDFRIGRDDKGNVFVLERSHLQEL